ncbi:MAG: VWA domain-containing protein [Fibrobacteria bacterium]|nr:VWA domain-containing protein [Fibrobacteria bacterium]
MFLPHFQHPYFLFLLLLVPLLALQQFRFNKNRKASIRFPSLKTIKKVPGTWALRVRHSLLFLRLAAISIMIIALARPQKGEALHEVSTHGVDIVLALDISTSMKTMDFKPKNRLHVAKSVIESFVLGRKTDRVGLVVFAAKSFTQCPLTLDYGILVQFLKQVDFNMVEDGTAIGTAILNSVNRLRDSKAESKIIVLLTDGENNAGEVDPITAAKAAEAMGIKIYTIGVGKSGQQPLEVEDPFFGKRIVTVETKIDEKTLKQIASLTDANYYRAQNPKALKDIYAKIDALEKSQIETHHFTRYHELFTLFLIIALIILFIEITLANTRFMKIP